MAKISQELTQNCPQHAIRPAPETVPPDQTHKMHIPSFESGGVFRFMVGARPGPDGAGTSDFTPCSSFEAAAGPVRSRVEMDGRSQHGPRSPPGPPRRHVPVRRLPPCSRARRRSPASLPSMCFLATRPLRMLELSNITFPRRLAAARQATAQICSSPRPHAFRGSLTRWGNHEIPCPGPVREKAAAASPTDRFRRLSAFVLLTTSAWARRGDAPAGFDTGGPLSRLGRCLGHAGGG